MKKHNGMTNVLDTCIRSDHWHLSNQSPGLKTKSSYISVSVQSWNMYFLVMDRESNSYLTWYFPHLLHASTYPHNICRMSKKQGFKITFLYRNKPKLQSNRTINLCGQRQTILIPPNQIYKCWQKKNPLNIATFPLVITLWIYL